MQHKKYDSQKGVIKMIKDSGDRTQFATGAVRDMGSDKGRCDLVPWNAVMDLSKHCEAGAKKYGENNVRLGIPAHSLYDSAMRHLMKWFNGWDDEDHLVAAFWNIAWLLEQRTTHPELDDLHNEAKHQLSRSVAKVKEGKANDKGTNN